MQSARQFQFSNDRHLGAPFFRRAAELGDRTFVKLQRGERFEEISWRDFGARVGSAILGLYALGLAKGDRVAIIERYLPGHDYRVVVLDGEIISAYERMPLSVIGDGKSTILQLLKAKKKIFDLENRDTNINFRDPRIKNKLKREGYGFQSIIEKGKKIYLLYNANLSTGGDSKDVTAKIHSGFKKIAIEITKKMGLRICGVDIMVTRGDITKDPKNCRYYIIEINAAPGLDHYVTTGKAQRKIVEAMYLKVLKALGKKD